MNAAGRPWIRVEHLLSCRGGAVESITLVISDSAAVLSLLKQGAGVDGYAPLELAFSMTFEPFKVELSGNFNRAAGHRLREALHDGIGKQWQWRGPRRSSTCSYISGDAGRVRIPVQRLWFSWNGSAPGVATIQDLKKLKSAWKAGNELGFYNDRLLSWPLQMVHGEGEISVPSQKIAEFLSNR